MKWSAAYGTIEHELPNGRLAEIVALTFGRARICLVSLECRLAYDDLW